MITEGKIIGITVKVMVKDVKTKMLGVLIMSRIAKFFDIEIVDIEISEKIDSKKNFDVAKFFAVLLKIVIAFSISITVFYYTYKILGF